MHFESQDSREGRWIEQYPSLVGIQSIQDSQLAHHGLTSEMAMVVKANSHQSHLLPCITLLQFPPCTVS